MMAVPDLRERQKQQELSGWNTGLCLSLSVAAPASSRDLEVSPASSRLVIFGDVRSSRSLEGWRHVVRMLTMFYSVRC